EEQGWFTFKTFKPGQGLRVRRGTILGILLLAGAGIWVMIQRGTVGRDSPDMGLNIPFTGKMVVTDLGDTDLTGLLRAEDVQQLRVREGGEAEGLKPETTADRDAVEKAIEPLAARKLQGLKELLAWLESQEKDIERRRTAAQDPALKASLGEE